MMWLIAGILLFCGVVVLAAAILAARVDAITERDLYE